MVAGAGVASLVFTYVLMINLMPLMIVVILSNFGIYRIKKRQIRIFTYLFSYILLVGLEYMIISWINVGTFASFFYFFLYLLLLLYFIYALKSILRNYTKKSIYIVSVLTLLVIAGIIILN